MVKCWNCKHLITAHSGKPRREMLFEKKLDKCRVKGIVFERPSEIREERECSSFEASKRWPKTSEPY